MLLLVVALLFVYNTLFFHCCEKLFALKQRYWLNYAIAITLNIACYVIIELAKLPQFGILIKCIILMMGLYLLFNIDLIQMLCGGVVYALILYSFKGVVISLIALILGKDINDIYQSDVSLMTSSLALLASILFLYFLNRTIAVRLHSRPFYHNWSQMKFVVLFQTALLLYIMLIFDGYNDVSNPVWFSIVYLFSSIWSIALLLIIWYKEIRTTYLQEYKWQTKQLKEQLERQLRHYKSYQKYTESFQNFKHDYNMMMSLVKTLINNNENDKASQLIDEIEHTMHDSVLVHKTYSNNFILDAILQDCANTCDEYQIRFSAFACIPSHCALSELDIIRIFSNALRNAVEACCRMEASTNRFIEVSSNITQGWSCIEIKNSFNGDIRLEDDVVVTMKQDKENHGFGIKILKDIIEKKGGLIHMEIDQVQNTFTTILHIPTM